MALAALVLLYNTIVMRKELHMATLIEAVNVSHVYVGDVMEIVCKFLMVNKGRARSVFALFFDFLVIFV